MNNINKDYEDDEAFLKDVQKYINCMEEIKLRQKGITLVLEGEYTTPYPMTNVEFLCLQFRKILELIAMASLSANKESYEHVYKKFFKHWNAKKILDSIQKINPNFYPVPGKQIIENNKVVEVVPITTDYLSKEIFIEVYNECSEMLHSKNPYNSKQLSIESLKPKFLMWNSMIIRLLNHHQLQLINSDYQLWVLMNGENDQRVHATIFKKIK